MFILLGKMEDIVLVILLVGLLVWGFFNRESSQPEGVIDLRKK